MQIDLCTLILKNNDYYISVKLARYDTSLVAKYLETGTKNKKIS